MKKSNKILLVLGSISSLSALPLVAASCGNKTKQEQENKSNDTSNNESSNQQKGDKDKDNKNDGVKPKDGNSQTEQGSNTSNNKDTTSKKDDEKNKNEDSNSANAKESNSVLKELEEKLTSLKALNSKIEEIEKELDKELDDENLGSSDTSNEEKEKTLENVNRVNETLTAFIGALEEIKKDDSYIKGEFQEELLEIFSEINEYIELIWDSEQETFKLFSDQLDIYDEKNPITEFELYSKIELLKSIKAKINTAIEKLSPDEDQEEDQEEEEKESDLETLYEVDEIIDSFISILEKIKAEDKNTYLDLDEELKEHLVEILDDIDDFIDIIFDSETNTLILNKSAIDAFGEKDINDVID